MVDHAGGGRPCSSDDSHDFRLNRLRRAHRPWPPSHRSVVDRLDGAAAGAARAFSIFMASRITTVSPSLTVSPTFLSYLTIMPGMGAGSGVPSMSAAGAGAASAFFSAGAAGAGAGAGAGAAAGAAAGRRRCRHAAGKLDLLGVFQDGAAANFIHTHLKYSLSTKTLKVRGSRLLPGRLSSFPPVHRPWLS
jgi:hypothetical protein